jgi:signal transduction histidine kinase
MHRTLPNQPKSRLQMRRVTQFGQTLLRAVLPSEQRFKLLRYFSATSLTAFLIATGLLAVFYRQRATRDLVTLTEDQNVTLTQIFANTLWPQYGPFLSSTQSLSDEELKATQEFQQLHQEILANVEGTAVLKIKFYDLQGRTVFSTDLGQVGDDKSDSSGFLAAQSGTVLSQLDHRDTFAALKQTLKDRHLLSSYVPIRAGGSSGEIVGVAELYTDVTPLIAHIHQTQRTVVVGSLLILGTLYGILWLIVQRGNRLIKQQYQQLEASEMRHRQQAEELAKILVELRKTQAQMVQSERLSSLGQLVAGVAHEINNPTNFIHGNLVHFETYAQTLLELLQRYRTHYPDPDATVQLAVEEADVDFLAADLPKMLASMRMGTDRIRQIVLSLRNFSRLDEATVKAVDIHEGLDSTLMILEHQLKEKPHRPAIQVIKKYGPLPKVECYAGQLNQVFMNILANAIDAVDEAHQSLNDENRDIGTITIETQPSDPGWVTVAIADTGKGMSPPAQRQLFDPFFTTKPVGKGTGLGMSISHQIITETHGGTITVDSELGRGTTLRIYIPVRQDP